MAFKKKQVAEYAFPFLYATIRGKVTSSHQKQDVVGKVYRKVTMLIMK